MVSTSIICPVHGFSVTGVDEEFLGSLGKAVASVEAKLAKERNALEVDDHVLHQLELADERLFLLGEVVSAHWRVHVEEGILELAEKVVLRVFVHQLSHVEVFKSAVISKQFNY